MDLNEIGSIKDLKAQVVPMDLGVYQTPKDKPSLTCNMQLYHRLPDEEATQQYLVFTKECELAESQVTRRLTLDQGSYTTLSLRWLPPEDVGYLVIVHRYPTFQVQKGLDYIKQLNQFGVQVVRGDTTLCTLKPNDFFVIPNPTGIADYGLTCPAGTPEDYKPKLEVTVYPR